MPIDVTVGIVVIVVVVVVVVVVVDDTPYRDVEVLMPGLNTREPVDPLQAKVHRCCSMNRYDIWTRGLSN